ncbi:MAG: hypothetical protein JO072_15545 [Parafilimonas sp.]|nr:hypothetical protein [Parafilimonas sp.]
MKKNTLDLKTLLCLLTICFMALTIPSSAQNKTATITGEVLDMDCYMKSGAHGADHKSCGDMCIKGGAPMGILTSDNKVYLLVADDSKKDAYEEAKKHAGEQVTVTGELSEKDGIKGLVVADVKAKS